MVFSPLLFEDDFSVLRNIFARHVHLSQNPPGSFGDYSLKTRFLPLFFLIFSTKHKSRSQSSLAAAFIQ
jgi:hypothetical protein